jgi:hypothetical protein
MNLIEKVKLLWDVNRLWSKSKKDTTMKPLLQSKTIWGLLVVAAPWVAKHWFSVDLDADTTERYLTQIAQIIGFITAVYGRVVATGGIKGVLK